MAFPREIPLTEYIQAIPEIMQLVNGLKYVLRAETYWMLHS